MTAFILRRVLFMGPVPFALDRLGTAVLVASGFSMTGASLSIDGGVPIKGGAL